MADNTNNVVDDIDTTEVDKQIVVYQDNQVFLYSPDSSSVRSTVYTRPGDIITFNFDISALRVEIVNGDIQVAFANGSTMTLISLASLGFGTDAPILRDQQGNLLSVSEFLNRAYVIDYTDAYLIVTNRDGYDMSADDADIISSASDNEDTLDGGNPISGAGTSDISNPGTISNTPNLGRTDDLSPFSGTGQYPATQFSSNLPFTSSASNVLPGTLLPDQTPNLGFTIFYGIGLETRNPITLQGLGVAETTYSLNYILEQGSDATEDKTALLSAAKLDLSTSTSSVMIQAVAEEMRYVIEIDYSGGTYPNFLSIQIGDQNYRVEGPGITLGDNGEYKFDSINPNGKIRFEIVFPYNSPAKNLDIVYNIGYVDPETGDNKQTTAVQPVRVVGVTTESDLGGDNDYVLSSGAPGINVSTGSGNDVILGGLGNNTIVSGSGTDYVFSGVNNDIINLGAGGDFYWATLGVDRIDGGAGTDTAYYNNYNGKIPKTDSDGNVVLDEEGNIVYEAGNLIDNQEGGKENFSDSFYNTFESSSGLYFFVGYTASELEGMTEVPQAVLEELSDKFDLAGYLNNTSILVSKGNLSGGKTSLFDIYSDVEVFYGTNYMRDYIRLSYNENTDYTRYIFNAGKTNRGSNDGVFIDKLNGTQGVIFNMTNESAANQGVLVGFYDSSSSSTSTVPTVNSAGSSQYVNFTIFTGSSGDDIFLGGLNYHKKEGVNYSFSEGDFTGVGVGEGFVIAGGKGSDTIDYSQDSRILSIVFRASNSQVDKKYIIEGKDASGNVKDITAVQTDRLVYDSTNNNSINTVIGTENVDKFYGSYFRHFDYVAGGNTQDILDYSLDTNATLTLVLGDPADGLGKIYKGILTSYNGQSEFQSFLDDKDKSGSYDSVGSNIFVKFSSKSDVIVSNENYDFDLSQLVDIGNSLRSDPRDYVSYVMNSQGIVVDVSDSGIVTVNKGSHTDTFSFSQSDASGATKLVFYGINGSDYDDIFNLSKGVANELHHINGGEGIDTIDYSGMTLSGNYGITISIGSQKSTSNRVFKDGGAIDNYTSIEKFIGTSGDDKVSVSDSATVDDIQGMSFDLGAGVDIVDFSITSSKFSTDGIVVTFDNATGETVMNVGVDPADPTKQVTFTNTEGITGTRYDDEVILDNFTKDISLNISGFLGNDTIDYSSIDVALEFDLLTQTVTKGAITDTIVDMEVFKGGTISNVFKSILDGKYRFEGNGADSTVSYVSVNSGVVFDLTNNTVYKYGYDSTDYLNAIVNGTLADLDRIDVYTGITSLEGSSGNDSFLLTEAIVNGGLLDLDGGAGDYDILDFSQFTSGITTRLDASKLGTTFNIDSGGNSYSISVANVEGIRGTEYDDDITLSGTEQFYIDLLGGNNTLTYETIPQMLPTSSISVVINSDRMDITKNINVSGANEVKRDILSNITNLILTDNRDRVGIRQWNSSFDTIDLGSGQDGSGKEYRDVFSLADYIAAKGSSTNVTVTLGSAANTAIIKNAGINETGESITILNAEEFRSTQAEHHNTNFNIVSITELSDDLSIIGSSTRPGTTTISFDSTVFTSGIRFDWSNATNGKNVKITAGSDSHEMDIRQINTVELTSNDDYVIGSASETAKFIGNGGADTLDYSSYNGVIGYTFTWDPNDSNVGVVIKNGIRDQYVGFTNIIGTSGTDTVRITDLSFINGLPTGYNIDLKSSISGNDIVFLDVAGDLLYEFTTGSVSSLGFSNINLSWITSTDSAGMASNLILRFGDGNDTVRFDAASAVSYTIVDGGSGNNVLESTSSYIFRVRDGHIIEYDSSLASYADMNTALDSSSNSMVNFTEIHGHASGNNIFFGDDPSGNHYIGSGNIGSSIDSLVYSNISLPLKMVFDTANSGKILYKISVPSGQQDEFTNIKHIVGSRGKDIFEFQDGGISYIQDLYLQGGGEEDSIYFNASTATNISITSTNLIYTTTSGNFYSMKFDNESDIQVFLFNGNIQDTLTVGENIENSLLFNGAYDTSSVARQDIIKYDVSNLIDGEIYALIF